MKRQQQIIELLDERWLIAKMKDATPADLAHYNGICIGLQSAGIDWQRDPEGNHQVFGTKEN